MANAGDVVLGAAVLALAGVGGYAVYRMTDPSRKQVPLPAAQPVVPPSSQPALPPAAQPVNPGPTPSPTPAPPYPWPPVQPQPYPTPTVTKGQLCADIKAQIAKVQSAMDDLQAKMNALLAKGGKADTNCWSYAKREACGLFDICSPALWGNYNACMAYVKGEGPRPGNLFNFDDSRAVDEAAQEYAKLKSDYDSLAAQKQALQKQLNQLAAEGVVC
jgi:hypothetical protein